MTEPTDLYRHFDKDGKLLYVGISLSAVVRMKQHKKGSRWYNSIANMKVEKFPSRQEAEVAEQLAIKNEKPKYNKMHNNGIPVIAIQTKKIENEEQEENRPLPNTIDENGNGYIDFGVFSFGAKSSDGSLFIISDWNIRTYYENGLPVRKETKKKSEFFPELLRIDPTKC